MELNKIAAAVILAGLIGMTTGKVAGFLYGGAEEAHHGEEHAEVKRGYSIEVPEGGEAGESVAAEGAAPVSILPLLASADAAAGEAYFSKKCTLCHGIDKGGANKTGPNLWGVVGSDIASHAGFNYSKALQAKEGKWDFDQLSAFLTNPKKFAPGTIMAYAGTKKDEERANLIAYLRLQNDAPLAIPAAPAPAAAAPTEADSTQANQ